MRQRAATEELGSLPRLTLEREALDEMKASERFEFGAHSVATAPPGFLAAWTAVPALLDCSVATWGPTMAGTITITPQDLGRSSPPLTALFDVDQAARTLRRHAVAAAMAKNVWTEWKRHEDLLVRFFSIGEPGLLEVHTSDSSTIRRDTDQIYSASLRALTRELRKANGGAVFDFLEDKERLARHYRLTVQRTLNETRQLNAEIGAEAAWTADKLFAIKVGADVAFNGLLALATMGIGTSIGAGAAYSMVTNVAMNRREMSNSDIVALATSGMLPATVANVGAKATLDLAEKAARGWLQQARQAISFEAQALKNYQNTLQPYDTGGRNMTRFRPSVGAQATGRETAKRAARVSGLGKGLGFVTSLYFLKDDIARAMKGYTSTPQASAHP